MVADDGHFAVHDLEDANQGLAAGAGAGGTEPLFDAGASHLVGVKQGGSILVEQEAHLDAAAVAGLKGHGLVGGAISVVDHVAQDLQDLLILGLLDNDDLRQI